MKENEEVTFYLCWAPGVMVESPRHATAEEARGHSILLSQRMGVPVYVLKAMGVSTPGQPPVTWADMKEKA